MRLTKYQIAKITAALVPLTVSTAAQGETLNVGAGKRYARVEEANAAARPGDTIAIYPAAGDGAYRQTAVRVTKPRLTFVGQGAVPVMLDGTGFNYTGTGAVPRAIIQVDPDAHGTVIENLEMRNARNESANGAGIRINQADEVTIRNCRIHHCDMGIMSNGGGDAKPTARDQLIERCIIYANGSLQGPGGLSHNFYLGGTSVTLRYCEVYGSTTGHNVKSRAHFNRIECNYIHDSANREIDLVDAAETELPNSHTAILGNIIVKKDPIEGNRAVIHFGQDGGRRHRGNIYLAHNTIVTPHMAAVIQITDPDSLAVLTNNILFNPRQNAPVLVERQGRMETEVVRGSHNWVSRGYDISKTGLARQPKYGGTALESHPGFSDMTKGDYRIAADALSHPAAGVSGFVDGEGKTVNWTPKVQYRAHADSEPRRDAAGLQVGAGAYSKRN